MSHFLLTEKAHVKVSSTIIPVSWSITFRVALRLLDQCDCEEPNAVLNPAARLKLKLPQGDFIGRLYESHSSSPLSEDSRCVFMAEVHTVILHLLLVLSLLLGKSVF